MEHASSGPQRLPDWNQNAGGIHAFYFRDPDGHYLEILQFPKGKGDPKWQPSEESLNFYRDTLGLKVVGENENYDTELNNVRRTAVDHQPSRQRRPGIEFLEYLSPQDGRPIPSGEKANDMIHWQTRLATQDVGIIAPSLLAAKAALVSSGTTVVSGKELGFQKGLLVRHPDGHVMAVTEERLSCE